MKHFPRCLLAILTLSLSTASAADDSAVKKLAAVVTVWTGVEYGLAARKALKA